MKTNCSRCGIKSKKLTHIPNFRMKGLKEANLCKDCLKWFQGLIKEGDYYTCKDCTKSCVYTKDTKKNYPYCFQCKKESKK